MQLGDTTTKRTGNRFDRFKIIFPILLAGWIPSILTLIVSYTILRDTLETRILRDRQTLIQLLGHVVGHDLSSSSAIINYYQTLPEVAKILGGPNPVPAAQQWLNSAYYSHPNIDGMFLAGPDGALLFANDFKPNPNVTSPQGGLLINEIRQNKTGHFEEHGNLYSFSPIEQAGWVAIVEQPKSLAYKPVHDLLGRMTILAAWLIVLTAVFAWLGNRFYQRQREWTQRLEREVIFNEKMLANMPSGIAFVEPASRRFLHANDAFARMAERFGDLPPGRDITEIPCDEVNIAPPGAIERVLTFGTPFQLHEHPLKDKTGVTHFLDINLLRLQGAQETVQGVLYLVDDKTRDVTLRQELIAANAAKDQFLALLSHELRNPLSPVIAMVSELEASVPDSPGTRQALEVIRRNVELEARLIDDLLDVTRIAKGKLQLTFETVSVNEIVQRAYEICREEATAKELTVEFRLNAESPFVDADPARLQQVFWNLIKNGVKFTPEHGRITIETRNQVPEEIEVRISDTCIGIEPDRLDRIFNAFEQGQVSITRRFGGLGLGLAISKAMVDAHGGKIRAESAGKDRGATFVITSKTVKAPVVTVAPNGDGARR